MSLERVVITGASTGIGAATAIRAARRGASVWITCRQDVEAAESVVAAARHAGAPEARLTKLDVGDAAELDAFIEDVRATWGGLSGLVNNAGMCPYTPPDDISIREWDRVMDVNVRAVFLLTRGLVPLMRMQREDADRSIVNIASTAGQAGSAITGMHYSASKGAVLSLTRSWAQFLASERIRVNAVAPGPVVSVMTDALQGDGRERMTSRIPLGAFGEPDDVASVVDLLVSPATRFTTGATYDVNGGTRMA